MAQQKYARKLHYINLKQAILAICSTLSSGQNSKLNHPWPIYFFWTWDRITQQKGISRHHMPFWSILPSESNAANFAVLIHCIKSPVKVSLVFASSFPLHCNGGGRRERGTHTLQGWFLLCDFLVPGKGLSQTFGGAGLANPGFLCSGQNCGPCPVWFGWQLC